MRRRSFKRYTRRLETEFNFRDRIFRGISSNLSERGLFIRTRHCLEPGSPLEITVYLPDNKKAIVKGIVRRSVKTDVSFMKNGMGIELMEYDRTYLEFIKTVIEGGLKAEPLLSEEVMADSYDPSSDDQTNNRILKCPHCGVKNRVPIAKLSLNPKCGRCKKSLTE